MIKVTDVAGNVKYINCELIEKIEVIPDTLLVLTNGHNFIVSEEPEEIINKIVEFKQQCYRYRNAGVMTVEHKVAGDEPGDATGN